MKKQLSDLILAGAADERQREQLAQPTTTFHLHKNNMEMKALYPRERREESALLSECEALAAEGVQKGFTAKYEKLVSRTRLKKEVEQSETVQPYVFGSAGPNEGYSRHLKAENKVIIGIDRKLKDRIGYVNKIGRTHLADNAFRTKRHYDELDVVSFDLESFAETLKRPGQAEQQEPEAKEESTGPRKRSTKSQHAQEIDHEFARLCVNRLKKASNLETILEYTELRKPVEAD